MKQELRFHMPYGLELRARGLCLSLAALLAIACGLSACNRTKSGRRATAAIVINEIVPNAVDRGTDPEDSRSQALLPGPDGRPQLDPEGTTGSEGVDWVEIYNPLDFAVNLAGYTLTDDPSRKRLYRFPSAILAPGEFAVVICDGREDLGPWHADFRLRAGGERVFLYGGDGASLVDQMSYGNIDGNGDRLGDFTIPENVSVGRYPDGGGGRGAYDVIHTPTPGASNVRPQEKAPHQPSLPVRRESAPGDELRITVTLRDDVLEFGGIIAASMEVQARIDCRESSGLPFSLPFPLEEQAVGGPPLIEVRERADGTLFEKIVRTATVSGTIVPAEVPGFDPEGFLRIRFRVENEFGVFVFSDCVRFEGERPTLVVSEYMPRNQTTLRFTVENELGVIIPQQTPDWFEIYNYGDQPIDLTGFRMIGDGDFRELFESADPRPVCPCDRDPVNADCIYLFCFQRFGIDSIGPGERIVLLADGDGPGLGFRKYTDEFAVEFRSTQFSLNANQLDSFGILDGDLQVVDRVVFNFSTPLCDQPPTADCPPAQVSEWDPNDARFELFAAPDKSFGRFPDGGLDSPPSPLGMADFTNDPPDLDPTARYAHVVMECPSPGEPNTIGPCPPEDIPPSWDPRTWRKVFPNRDREHGWEPIGPRDNVKAVAFASLDADTFDSGLFELEFQATAALPGGGIDEFVLVPGDGVNVVPRIPACDELCFETIVERNGLRNVTFEANLPRFEAGTVVSYRWVLRDLLVLDPDTQQPSVAVLEASASSRDTSFSYRVQENETPLVHVNEVVPGNTALLSELFPPGSPLPDYAELYNASGEVVPLEGMFLSPGTPRDCGDFACYPLPLRDLRAFEFPAGAVIGPGEFVLVVFTRTAAGHAAPKPIGTPWEGRVIEARDVPELDDCRGTVFLFDTDTRGNAPISSLSWDFRAAGASDCAAPPENAAIGLIPDGGEVNAVGATPGESNCIASPPELARAIRASVNGAPDAGACLRASDALRLNWRIVVDRVGADPGGDELAAVGLRAVSVTRVVDGAPEAPMALAELDHTITEIPNQDFPCQRILEIDTAVPIPDPAARGGGAGTLEVAIDIEDFRGDMLGLDSAAFALCGEDGALFIRGDVSGDGRVNTTDLVRLVRIVNGSDPRPDCEDRADVNDDGDIDGGDTEFLSAFLGGVGPSIPAPFPAAGPDPTDDGLPCR